MDLFDEDYGLAGLTQFSRMENSVDNNDFGFIEEDLVSSNVVSLEDNDFESKGTYILYDNVVAEDISSDDDIDKM